MQVFISNYNYHNYRVILECWEKYGQKNEKKKFITSMVNLFFFQMQNTLKELAVSVKYKF